MNSDLPIALPIPPEEWDFRMIGENADLETVIEYEYLRSSYINQTIVAWHDGKFGDSFITKAPELAGILQAAGLLEIPENSPLDEFLRYSKEHGPKDFEQFEKLQDAALEQLKNVRWGFSIREVIRRVNDNLLGDQLSLVLVALKMEMPECLKTAKADKIALRFDGFPMAWIKLLKTEGVEYIRRRCCPLEPESPVLWEIENPSYPGETFELSPLCRRYEFGINWGHGVDDIVKAFRTWVIDKHVQSRPGHRSAVKWLKWLAAYRLNNQVEFTKLHHFLDQYKKEYPRVANYTFPDFQDQTSWSRAAGKAKKVLSGDFIAEIRKTFGHFA